MFKRRYLSILLAVLVTTGVAGTPAAHADRKGDQENARLQMKSAKIMKLREIEAKVLPRMKGMQYLGPEYDSTVQVYRLKFINRDRVVFVDVDARSGRILQQR